MEVIMNGGAVRNRTFVQKNLVKTAICLNSE